MHGTDQLGARAFGRAAGVSCPRHVLFGDRARHQREIQHHYSRNATIGRARRMGLARSPARAKSPPPVPRGPAAERAPAARALCRDGEMARAAYSNGSRADKLRCVDSSRVICRCSSSNAGDCRYPYGGDAEGEAITFCGHPQREDSSYCAAHFHLTRGPRRAPERPASTALAADRGGGMKGASDSCRG